MASGTRATLNVKDDAAATKPRFENKYPGLAKNHEFTKQLTVLKPVR